MLDQNSCVHEACSGLIQNARRRTHHIFILLPSLFFIFALLLVFLGFFRLLPSCLFTFFGPSLRILVHLVLVSMFFSSYCVYLVMRGKLSYFLQDNCRVHRSAVTGQYIRTRKLWNHSSRPLSSTVDHQTWVPLKICGLRLRKNLTRFFSFSFWSLPENQTSEGWFLPISKLLG